MLSCALLALLSDGVVGAATCDAHVEPPCFPRDRALEANSGCAHSLHSHAAAFATVFRRLEYGSLWLQCHLKFCIACACTPGGNRFTMFKKCRRPEGCHLCHIRKDCKQLKSNSRFTIGCMFWVGVVTCRKHTLLHRLPQNVTPS
jgi:hypothetical protein